MYVVGAVQGHCVLHVLGYMCKVLKGACTGSLCTVLKYMYKVVNLNRVTVYCTEVHV